jgi:hypothetical protein
MDKDEIGRALAKVLAENGYINIIEDDVTKKDILDRAKWYEEVKDKDVSFPLCIGDFTKNWDGEDLSFESMHESIMDEIKQKAKKLGANYLFTKTSINMSECRGYFTLHETMLATPYVIILPDMEEKLQKCYKGGAPREIVDAAHDYFGFKLEPDMVQMYRDSPDDFKYYLRNMDEEKVFQVLTEVVKIEERDKELDKWLMEKYPELSKKAARGAV